LLKELNEDFDFDIPSILLAHRFSFTAGSRNPIYEKGRKISGIVYCSSGSALYKFDDSEILLRAGEIIFLPKNCAYVVTNVSDEDFLHITVNFDITGLSDYNAPYAVVKAVYDSVELLQQLVNVWTEKKQGYRPRAKSILYDLLYRYFKNVGKIHRTEEYGRVMPAKRMLDEKYRENISVSVLAAACGFSETHFRRVFKKTFGCSPTEYRLKKRIILAKELLRNGELSICEISQYSGFDDSGYFSRIFKKETGVTPVNYRKKQR